MEPKVREIISMNFYALPFNKLAIPNQSDVDDVIFAIHDLILSKRTELYKGKRNRVGKIRNKAIEEIAKLFEGVR